MFRRTAAMIAGVLVSMVAIPMPVHATGCEPTYGSWSVGATSVRLEPAPDAGACEVRIIASTPGAPTFSEVAAVSELFMMEGAMSNSCFSYSLAGAAAMKLGVRGLTLWLIIGGGTAPSQGGFLFTYLEGPDAWAGVLGDPLCLPFGDFNLWLNAWDCMNHTLWIHMDTNFVEMTFEGGPAGAGLAIVC